jgi:hypothetical protein
MAERSNPSKKNEIRDLSRAEAARLAGAIWIYGGIHVSGSNPRIVITMPVPLVYEYQKDFGGSTYRGEDGYFTLQIAGRSLVKKRLKEIQSFMSGEEVIQIGLALEIIRTKEEWPASERKVERLNELTEDWKRSRDRLKQWIEDFVKDHKDEIMSEGEIPTAIWNKAYAWTDFMKKNGYERIPEMMEKPANKKP